MATTPGRTQCITCGKEKVTSKCSGCFQDFCYNHLGDHRQELNKQLDEIEVNRDLLRQSLTQQIERANNNILIQQIDQWEQNSIKIIQQTAERARQILIGNTNKRIYQIELKLNKLNNQLRESRQENDFNEINLSQFQEELSRLTKELTSPSTVSIREDSTSFINKISVVVPDNDVNLISKSKN
jgi:hypothetical protein